MRNATPVLPFKMRRPTRRHYFLRVNFRPISFFTRTTRAKINPAWTSSMYQDYTRIIACHCHHCTCEQKSRGMLVTGKEVGLPTVGLGPCCLCYRSIMAQCSLCLSLISYHSCHTRNFIINTGLQCH